MGLLSVRVVILSLCLCYVFSQDIAKPTAWCEMMKQKGGTPLRMCQVTLPGMQVIHVTNTKTKTGEKVRRISVSFQHRSRVSSCKQLLQLNPGAKSGFYFLTSGGRRWKAYCEMKKFGGGWTRIANIKPREQKKCPGQMKYSSSNQGVCQLASSHHGTRRGATFSSKGITYTSVMGYVHGYQAATNDAFGQVSKQTKLTEGYMDGISLTYGSPVKHLWSYAVTHLSKNHAFGCPCAAGSKGKLPPSFVGKHYFCSHAPFSHHWVKAFTPGTCEEGCCGNNFPWFKRFLGARGRCSPIGVYLVNDQNTRDENVAVSDVEVYVR